MAENDSQAWGDAIDSLIEANEKAGRKPDSIRSLAAALAALPGSTQKAENWKGTINRIRRGEQQPEESTARAIADAFSVDRESLPPPATPQTIQRLARELQRVEEWATDEVTDLHAALVDAVARIEALERQARAGGQQASGNQK